MVRLFQRILATGLLVGCGAAWGMSQAGGAESPKKASTADRKVVVVDIGAALRSIPALQKQVMLLGQDMKRSEETLAKSREEIRGLADRLKAAPAGSKEAESLRKELQQREMSLTAIIELQRKEFAAREMQMHQEFYRKVYDAIDAYAKEHRVSVVLRGDRPVAAPAPAAAAGAQPRPEPTPPATAGAVVWREERVDITPAIIARLNAPPGERRSATPAADKADGKSNKKSEGKSDEKPADKSKDKSDGKSDGKSTHGRHWLKSLLDRHGKASSPKSDEAKSSESKSGDASDDSASDDDSEGDDWDEDDSDDEESGDAEPAKEHGAKSETTDKASEARRKRPNVVRITLRGEYPEGSQTPGFMSRVQVPLLALLERLDKTAKDSSVDCVILDFDGLEIGTARAYEIRGAVARLREAGKPVYAIASSLDQPEYLLASACNEIVLAPCGMVTIPGVRAEVTFYKGLLDKLGLKFESMQMGKYKGAFEPFTREGMSPALRESMEAVIDDGFDSLVTTIAADRKLDEDRVTQLVDRGLFTASAAAKAGLVNHTAYADEFLETLRKRLGAESLNIIQPSKRRSSVSLDISEGPSMGKLFGLMLGGGKRESASAGGRRIALIYAVGTITDGESGDGTFGSRTVGASTLAEAVRNASEDPRVCAIVLRIDSPGGSAIASDLIWRELRRSKKPVIASMGEVAGSGGYYLAVGARKIYAEPTTITGSIGVIGGKLVTQGLYDKVGITTETITRGKNGGLLGTTSVFSPDERAAMQETLSDTYDRFLRAVAEGRSMPKKQVHKLAQGRIYTGRMAAANGLVDRVGTLHDAMAAAKKSAGLKKDDKVELMVLPRPKSIFEQLFAEPSVSSAVPEGLRPAIEMLTYAETLQKVLASRILVLMPCSMRLR